MKANKLVSRWGRTLAACLALAIVAMPRSFAADPVPAPATSSAAVDTGLDVDFEDSPLLAGEYRDESKLLRFCPPLGVRLVQRGGQPKDVVSFFQDAKRWAGTIQIVPPADEKGIRNLEPKRFMEIAAGELMKSFKNVHVLSTQELTISGYKAGRMMCDFETEAGTSSGGRAKEVMIRQTLCIQLPPLNMPIVDDKGEPIRHDGQIQYKFQPRYMVMHFFSPLTSQAEASKTFDAMVTHFQILDPKKIEERRKVAIKAGRDWLASISAEKLKVKLLTGAQIFRMRVDGTDVGYTSFIDQVSPRPRDGYEGIVCTMSSRSFPNADMSLEFHMEAFWAFKENNSKFDKETYYSGWTSSTVNNYLQDNLRPDRTWYNEIGIVGLEPSQEPGVPKNPVVPTPENTKTAIMVSRTGDKRIDPNLTNKTFNWIAKPEQPAVLPKALENITWPRLVDLKKPASYAFVVFNGPSAKLGLRTLTVYAKKEVTIDGKPVQAIKLTDEMDPSTTTLYVDDDGKVLYMKTSDGTSLTPTTEAEMLKLWAHRINNGPKVGTPAAPAGNEPFTPGSK